MSVKTIWEKPMRKYFFTPPQEEGQREKSREDDRKEKLLWTEGRWGKGERVGAPQKCWPIPTLASLGFFPSYGRPKEPQRTQSVSLPHPRSAGHDPSFSFYTFCREKNQKSPFCDLEADTRRLYVPSLPGRTNRFTTQGHVWSGPFTRGGECLARLIHGGWVLFPRPFLVSQGKGAAQM